MERLNALIKRLTRPNPIIVKELRSRMRGARAFIILTATLVLMALISYALYRLVIITASWSYTPLSPQIGQSLFVALALLEMLMICLITPAITAGAISSEHENLTYEMLLTTPLKPTRILWGKLVSALSYIFLLILAAIPLASLVFIYGGVSLRDMIKALIVLFCTAIMIGTIGIFTSTWLKRTGRATVISYLIVLALMGAPTFIYGIVALIRQAEPPRWILVASPVSALFSAIAPSTSLGSSSLSMIGGLSMLMAGNIGFISTNSIPRPLYHYTLPLYGLVTLLLYMFASRLVRPARRWRLRGRELLIALLVIAIFLATIALAFGRTTDRYENISIFAAPTPPMGDMTKPMSAQAVAIPATQQALAVSDAEAISAYSTATQALSEQGFLPAEAPIYLSRLIYLDPAQPDLYAESTFKLSENITEGISSALEETAPADLIWLDDFFAYPPQGDSNSDEASGALILWGYLNPLKTGMLQLQASLYTGDQPQQDFTINFSNANGRWEVQNLTLNTPPSTYPGPQPLTSNQSLSDADLVDIYSFAILQAYTNDNPLAGNEIKQLYIVQNTALAAEPTDFSPEMQAGIIEWLAGLPFKITWVESADSVTLEGLGKDAIVTLGNIVPHDEQSFEVMIDLRYNEQNKTLLTYIFQNIPDGGWQIVEFGGNG